MLSEFGNLMMMMLSKFAALRAGLSVSTPVWSIKAVNVRTLCSGC
jgi:hypothetical protein